MTGNDDRSNIVTDAQVRVVAVRDSKDPDGPKLFFTAEAWRDLLDRIKAGELALPDHMREGLDERFT